MTRITEKIRYLLCEPWDQKKPTNNMVFTFEGKLYHADSCHRTIEEAIGFSKLFKNNFKIARVIFLQTENIDGNSPHKFLGWAETKNQTDSKPQSN